MARKKQAQKKQQKQQGTALAIVAQKPSVPRSDEDDEPLLLPLQPAGSASKDVAKLKKKKKVKKADKFQNRPRYTAQERKEMAEDAKARREEQARDAADADYDPTEGEEQEALDRAADEEDPSYEEEIVPDDVGTGLVRVGQKRKARAPRPSQIQQHKIKEREALACTEITTCKDQEDGDDGRPRQTETVLTYPKWIDNKAVQNVTLGKLCLERGWDNSGYNHINHCKQDNKRWWLRRWYTKNPDKCNLPVAPPTDEEIAERVDRAADAVDRRAAKAARTKGNSAALVTTTHVAGVPPAVHEAMVAQQKITDDKVKELEAQVELLNAKLETAENDAKHSRAEISSVRQDGQADLRRMTQAVTNVCGQAALDKVAAEFQELVEEKAKATTPWDKAMAHAKRVNDQAFATAEAGEALKHKIVEALNVRHSEKGNHALVCAETSIGFLKNALAAFPNLLTAVQEGTNRDLALAKKEAKEQQQQAARIAAQHQTAMLAAAASYSARRAAENADIDELQALENAAAADGVYPGQA